MKTIKKHLEKSFKPVGVDFFERFWGKSWTYVKTVVDIVHEPVLILDEDFQVVAANEAFYEMFQVKTEDTEGKMIYELGNGQWDIPSLRTLLESILPEQTFFKGFQVAHEFPLIGRRVMILNARQIHITEDSDTDPFPSTIVLAIEDVTDMMVVAESLTDHAKKIEHKFMLRTQKMETIIAKLQTEINEVKNSRKS